MVNESIVRPSLEYSQHRGSFPHIKTDLWAMVGQDGGQSIEMGEQTLFVFSDTLLASTAPAQEGGARRAPGRADPDAQALFLANCAAVTSGKDLRQALARLAYLCDEEGYPKEILVATPEEQAAQIRFWPEHGIFVDGQVYLYYLGIQTVDAQSIWGFRNLGVGLAILDPQTGTSRRILRNGDWRLWNITADDFHFGVQVLAQDDDLVLFGSIRRGYDVCGIVSRVPFPLLGDPDAYTYQNDLGHWTPSLQSATSIGPVGPEYSVSYNPYLKQFLLVYADPYHKDLYIRLAYWAHGPYSAPVKIGRLPHHPDSELIYMSFEHPRFATQGGKKVYITYCQPSFSSNDIVELCFR